MSEQIDPADADLARRLLAELEDRGITLPASECVEIARRLNGSEVDVLANLHRPHATTT